MQERYEPYQLETDIDQINAATLAKRSTFLAFNKFSAEQLDALPPYYGWVECDSGQSKFVMFLGGNDDGIASRFFWNGSYEKTTLELWSRLAKNCALALDIGAHTGVYTLAAKTANRDISVGVFEPNPANFNRLCLNMNVNNIHLRNASMVAVSDKDGMLPFSVPENSYRLTSGGSIGLRENAVTYQVHAVALDNAIPAAAKPLVGMVKIDTEGHEGQVLQGMREIIETAKPIIFFECIDLESGAAVEHQLRPLGYRFFEVDDEAGTIDPVDTVKPHFDLAGKALHSKANRIALREGESLF